MKKIILLIMMLAFLNGCSSTAAMTAKVPGSSAPKANVQLGWKDRQASLKRLPSWRLGGRAAVAYNDENWPFALDWQKRSANSYRMVIMNPLTKSTVATVDQVGGQVVLSAKGRTYRDSSAERLIEKNLGVKIPTKGMQHWVLGLLSPQYPVVKPKLDGRGRPRQIKQGGWTVDYLRYQNNSITALPTLIKIHRSSPTPVQVKLSVKKWNP
ncbi:MAG: outer membrane lipoprotein LolB [Thiotrichaceae bacterium]|nr:outer membrane lipoprotein LolB [Thiotrichaceae bacterium]